MLCRDYLLAGAAHSAQGLLPRRSRCVAVTRGLCCAGHCRIVRLAKSTAGRAMSNNPYAAPTADVRDIAGAQEYQEIRLWSASGRIGRLRYLAYSFGPAFLVGLIAGLLTPAAPIIMPIIVLPVYLAVLVFSI